MRRIALTLIMMLCVCSIAVAQDVGVNYSDMYRWHGWRLYEENIIHTSVNAEIRGFDIDAVGHYENEDNDLKKMDTSLAYQIPLRELIVKPSYGYVFLPGMDAQEVGLTLGLPGNISPRYSIYHVVPDNSQEGQFHVLGVDVFLGDPNDPNAISAGLMAEVTYNDGVNPFGQTVIRDWSHFTAAAQLNVPFDDIILQPGIMFQHTFDELVENDKNDCWYTIGFQYRF